MISNKSIAIIKVYLSIVLILAILFLLLSPGVAFAESSSGSNVLDDLSIDESFNALDYPIDQTDYSLKLIQIAESTEDRLLVYVYQPSAGYKNILATQIRFAVNNENVQDYSLTLLSQSGVFFKYQVDHYQVDKKVGMRNYNIIQLCRKTNEDLGDIVVDDNNNTIYDAPYPVGKTIGACYVNDNLCYSSFDFEIVEITDKYVGQLRYNDGFTFKDIIGINQACMSHYIAFNTDRDIDRICDITIDYSKQRKIFCNKAIGSTSLSEHEIVECKGTTLTCDDVGMYDGGGIMSHKYSWKRIESVDEFIADNTYQTLLSQGGITEECQANLANKQWVVRFAETMITFTSNDTVLGRDIYTEYWEVYGVTVLWLTFETDGTVYSLGCVDNHSKGDGIADNWQEVGLQTDVLLELLQKILGIIGIILIAVAVIAIVVLVKPVGDVIKFIVKFIWAIISAPFKFIVWLFRGDKK